MISQQKQLNNLLEKAVEEGVFPGANYTIVTNDNVYYGSVGNKALQPSVEENNIDTIYDMASLSKVVVTTTLIMKLVEDGKVRLYDPVQVYLPRFKHDDILVWDLMTHSSGLPADVSRAAKIASKEEALDKIYSAEKTYDKNEKIVYSDIGYMLLGFLIESVTSKSLDIVAQEMIFDPLNMKDSGYFPKDITRVAPTEFRHEEVFDGLLRGKVHDEKAYILGGPAGHAGLFSTVKDVSHFLTMFLQDGMYQGKQFFSKATIDLLFRAQVEVKNKISLDTEKRGLGWIVQGNYSSASDLASPETILHTGFTGTNIFIDRKNKIAFCMLSNRVHPTRDNIKIIRFRPKVGNFVLGHFI